MAPTTNTILPSFLQPALPPHPPQNKKRRSPRSNLLRALSTRDLSIMQAQGVKSRIRLQKVGARLLQKARMRRAPPLARTHATGIKAPSSGGGFEIIVRHVSLYKKAERALQSERLSPAGVVPPRQSANTGPRCKHTGRDGGPGGFPRVFRVVAGKMASARALIHPGLGSRRRPPTREPQQQQQEQPGTGVYGSSRGSPARLHTSRPARGTARRQSPAATINRKAARLGHAGFYTTCLSRGTGYFSPLEPFFHTRAHRGVIDFPSCRHSGLPRRRHSPR